MEKPVAKPKSNLSSYYPSKTIIIAIAISIIIILAIIIPIVIVFGKPYQLQGTSSATDSYSPSQTNSNPTTATTTVPSSSPQTSYKPILSIPDELWGYYEVRPGAHMFWWFYGYRGSQLRSQMPLILWMSGGPGYSSVGKGNFGQVGPIQLDLKPRNKTLIKRANVLFIDYPVGTGFSYVDKMSAYSRSDNEVAQDLYRTFAHVLHLLPSLRLLPFHLVAESYGGKIGSMFGNLLLQAKKEGRIQCNFISCILSSPLLSTADTIEFAGPYLNAFSLIDAMQSQQLLNQANSIKQYLQQKRGIDATAVLEQSLERMVNISSKANLHNVINYLSENPFTTLVKRNYTDIQSLQNNPTIAPTAAYAVMNNQIRHKLGIVPRHVKFASSNILVYALLRESICYPSIANAEAILNANVSVLIINGQFDAFVNGISLQKTIKKINWPYMKLFQSSKKAVMKDDAGRIVGFIKKYRNLSFMTMIDKGHSPILSVPDSYIGSVQN